MTRAPLKSTPDRSYCTYPVNRSRYSYRRVEFYCPNFRSVFTSGRASRFPEFPRVSAVPCPPGPANVRPPVEDAAATSEIIGSAPGAEVLGRSNYRARDWTWHKITIQHNTLLRSNEYENAFTTDLFLFYDFDRDGRWTSRFSPKKFSFLTRLRNSVATVIRLFVKFCIKNK